MSPLKMEQKEAELYSGDFCSKIIVGQLPMWTRQNCDRCHVQAVFNCMWDE